MVSDGGNMKINSGKGGGLSSSKTGPTRRPKKDFQKVLAKERREGKEEGKKKEIVKEDKDVKGKESFEDVAEKLKPEEMAPKTKGVSLFDLAGTKKEGVEEAEALKKAEGEEMPITQLSKELQEESLSALFKGYGSKERLKAIQEEVDTARTKGDHVVGDKSPKGKGEIPSEPEKPALDLKNLAVNDPTKARREPMEDLVAETSDTGPKSALPTEKGQFSGKFAQEQADLASINPLAGTQAAGAAQASQVQGAQQAQSSASQLQEIVDQIIDKLYTVNKSGRTDTLIKLRHPPLFAGSSVVITSFDTAKGEFNITFENLTQAAKQMLDMRENQEALKFALDQKGYTVHIITTTTLSETLDLVEGKTPERERGESEEGEAQSQGRDEREEKEEKEL